MIVTYPAFDESFYNLCLIANLILVDDYLDSAEGREKIKEIFRSAIRGAGTPEEIAQIPEFKRAVNMCDAWRSGVTNPFEAELPKGIN